MICRGISICNLDGLDRDLSIYDLDGLDRDLSETRAAVGGVNSTYSFFSASAPHSRVAIPLFFAVLSFGVFIFRSVRCHRVVARFVAPTVYVYVRFRLTYRAPRASALTSVVKTGMPPHTLAVVPTRMTIHLLPSDQGGRADEGAGGREAPGPRRHFLRHGEGGQAVARRV